MPISKRKILFLKRINELNLEIKGSALEKLILQLYSELENTGIAMKPGTYISDGWGCPDRVPVIGIPFYLVEPQLRRLRSKLLGFEIEDDAQLMMTLRHETGHAFNYAYNLYQKPEWRKVFGRFSLPYRWEYRPVPFSARYVRHIPGWYVQKHPDEDFAETFAVWLTPDSGWRQRYAGTPALVKLEYVDRLVVKYGRRRPAVTGGELHMPLEKMTMTVDAWFQEMKDFRRSNVKLPGIIDEDLKRLFPAGSGQTAADVIRANRRLLFQNVHLWTGIDRDVLAALVEELAERVQHLGLNVAAGMEPAALSGISVFITTLVMNYLYKGQFVET